MPSVKDEDLLKPAAIAEAYWHLANQHSERMDPGTRRAPVQGEILEAKPGALQRKGSVTVEVAVSNAMSVHSASGRKSVRIPKGPAKVIPLPTGRRRRQRYRRTVGIGIASLGMAAAGAALIWLYLVPLIGLAPDLTAGMSAQEARNFATGQRRAQARRCAPRLKSSQRLVLASRGHSYDMALRNYLGHDGPAGDTPAERVRGVGVDSATLGENIYLDRDPDDAKLAERTVRHGSPAPSIAPKCSRAISPRPVSELRAPPTARPTSRKILQSRLCEVDLLSRARRTCARAIA